jgi:hypothetical protein
MSFSTIKAFAAGTVLTLAALSPVFSADVAEAGTSKRFLEQTYRLDKPLHGYEGRAGDYYCSYIRVPVHKIDANGRMKVVAWELRQTCQ